MAATGPRPTPTPRLVRKLIEDEHCGDGDAAGRRAGVRRGEADSYQGPSCSRPSPLNGTNAPNGVTPRHRGPRDPGQQRGLASCVLGPIAALARRAAASTDPGVVMLHVLLSAAPVQIEAAGFILRGIKGIFVAVGSVIAAVLCAVIAGAKGRSAVLFGILGLFFSIITLIVVIVIPRKHHGD